jgi:hypothetical protein
MKKLLQHIMLLALLALCLPQARAQQYASTTITNNTGAAVSWGTGTATNWNAAVSVPKFGDFALTVRVAQADTAGAAGTMDVRWSTSIDGTTWANGLNASGSSGWFSVPLTNSGAVITWNTNITLNSVGYWRIDWITNASGKTLTNFNVKVTTKPKRFGN